MPDGRRTRRRRGVDVQGRTRAALLVAVGLLILGTIAGLVLLWPSGEAKRPQFAEPGTTFPHGQVLGVRDVPCPSGSPAGSRCGTARVRVTEGPDTSKVVEVQLNPDVMAVGVTPQVILLRTPVSGSSPEYSLQDLERGRPLLLLALLFVVVVVLVARLRGVMALVGLAIAAGVMYLFMLPALIDGENPVSVALIASCAIMIVVLYLTHGLSLRTTTALLGTVAGLGLTALIAGWAVGGAHLTGSTTDESSFLRQQVAGLSFQDLLLCGVVLAGLGVLNDVTITQSSAVWELREAAPGLSRRRLFTRAMRIGSDHIASSIYTIVFVYAGASLSVLMLIVLYAQPLSFTITSSDIAEEVVRTLASAIGLVLAVPATTAVAVLSVAGGQSEPTMAPGG